MSNSVETRIRGTAWQSVYYELLRSSIHFPLANVLIEMILEGVDEVITSADFYGSIGGAAIQAWFLGYNLHRGRPMPLIGNLIGPAIYTIVELSFTSGSFLKVPFHLVYWVFSLIIGILQKIRLTTERRVAPLLLLLENLARAGIVIIMFWFIQRQLDPSYNTFNHFIYDKPHLFIALVLSFLGVVTGLDEIRAERFLSLLRETAEQLQQYSRWLMGRDLLSVAITNPDALSLQRRERSVLFVDIRKFTQWSENQPPEVVVAMLNRYYDTGEKALEQSGMIQIKYTADEIMVFFSTPEEGVEGGIKLHSAVASVLADYGLQAGAGLHTGSVVEGFLGSMELKRYDIIGDTVNTAKRICSAAAGDELLVSDKTMHSLPDKYTYLNTRSIDAKGKSQPLTVHLVKLPTLPL